MAQLKIFVSSTCYDLSIVRSQLRSFLIEMGYEPVMSDYSDILYDPRSHTHENCLKEVMNCDMAILIIGSRFGGKAIPKAIELVDIDTLKTLSKGTKSLETKDIYSITQLEIFKAIENGIPIFTFVDTAVNHDHLVYEKNKDKGIIKEIDFPSIEKKETATYIFEFINFLRLRSENNSIAEFSKMDDIEQYLRKQWSAFFQRLLYEQRTKKSEERKMESLSNQIADLRTAIMTSISSADLRETAKGAIKYRRLIEFIHEISPDNYRELLLSDYTWQVLIHEKTAIAEIVQLDSNERTYPMRGNVFLIKEDRTFFRTRFPMRQLLSLESHWQEFKIMSESAKTAIINAIVENSIMGLRHTRYYEVSFEEYLEQENRIPVPEDVEESDETTT